MKIATLLTATAALLATTANAGIGFGACPTVTTIPYDAAMETSHGHQILYLDTHVFKILKFASIFISQVKNLQCWDFGSFGYTNAMYTEQFTNAQNAKRTMLVYYEPNTGTEVHYACLDAARGDQLLDYAVSQGVNIPAWLLKILTKIFTVVHIDGVLVLSGQAVLDDATTNTMANTVHAAYPGYSFSQITKVNKSGCV